MKKITLLLIIGTMLIACNHEKATDKNEIGIQKADTLTYTYDSIKVYSKNIIKTDSKKADTTKAMISYPVFKNVALNSFIQHHITDYIAKEEENTSYQYIADSFVKGYDQFYLENKDSFQYWFLMINVKVVSQKQHYIALQYLHSDFSGGAHPNTNFSYINYNPTTNQPVTLDSLIDSNQKPKLLSVAEKIFRSNEKLSATAPLTDKYFFDKGVFSLPENFYVSNKGLVFLYNPYEIKAYVFGTTELLIPFTELKEIARPNTILTTTN